MKVLVINAGSSSLKYQLIDVDSGAVIAKGLCERIGIDGSKLTYKPTGKDSHVFEKDMKDHAQAIRMVLEALADKDIGVVKSMDEIDAVGHRVLHGGEKFSEPVVINDNVLATIEECVPLGPLHNPANLMGIRGCMEVMPGVPMVAVFDTAWGQTMPKEAFIYALPYDAYTKYQIRRYGFHGTSHRYVTGRAVEKLVAAGMKKEDTRVITCHLGNGSSVSAARGGKCIDTSMGLTPLEGLPMGTRCGDIDPAIVPFIMQRTGMTPAEMDTYMNKKSGMLGLSGVSSDFRDLEAAAKEGNELVMNLGYSHPVKVAEIDGITIDVPGPNKIVISGPDKQKVGQFAAEVREKRPPEPYKGKGIKYVDEVIRRKVGKTGAKK